MPWRISLAARRRRLQHRGPTAKHHPLTFAPRPRRKRAMTRIALITGATRGLGAALAVALAPAFHIVAVARTMGALEELDDAIQARGGQATLAPMDITTADAMQQLCRGIHDRWGQPTSGSTPPSTRPPSRPRAISTPRTSTSPSHVNADAPRRRLIALCRPAPRPRPQAAPSSSTTRARARSSSAPMARPRPPRSRSPAAGRPKRAHRPAGRHR